MQCPKCSDGSSTLCRGKWNTVYPSGCLVIIGPILAMLHQAAAPFNYECKACGHEFKRRTTTGRVALVMILIVLIFYIAQEIWVAAAVMMNP